MGGGEGDCVGVGAGGEWWGGGGLCGEGEGRGLVRGLVGGGEGEGGGAGGGPVGGEGDGFLPGCEIGVGVGVWGAGVSWMVWERVLRPERPKGEGVRSAVRVQVRLRMVGVCEREWEREALTGVRERPREEEWVREEVGRMVWPKVSVRVRGPAGRVRE